MTDETGSVWLEEKVDEGQRDCGFGYFEMCQCWRERYHQHCLLMSFPTRNSNNYYCYYCLGLRSSQRHFL